MTDDETLYTLSELLLLYELEPQVRDVIVEGSNDLVLLREALNRRGLGSSASVYMLSERVRLPKSYKIPAGMDDGVRARIWCLAEEFDARFASGHSSSRCLTAVVDRDWSADVHERPNCLLITDYASIELYAWDQPTLSKFIMMGLRPRGTVHIEALMNRLEPVLVRLFLARRVAHELGAGDSPPEKVERYCDLGGGRFLSEKFLKAYGGETARQSEQLCARIDEMFGSFRDDVRLCIDGHDVVRLVARAIRSTGAQPMEQLEKLWMISIDINEIWRKPLFKALEGRVSA